MTNNIQQWLENNYPSKEVSRLRRLWDGSNNPNRNKRRNEITRLDISRNSEAEKLLTEGPLTLEGFDNLRELNCAFNKITSLEIENCSNLEKIICSHNQLTELNLQNFPKLKTLICNDNRLTNLNLSSNKELEDLNIMDNNFAEQNLSFLKSLTRLKELRLGNSTRINEQLYNNFHDSLEPLKNINGLKLLDIRNTDISKGLEYLPGSVDFFNCLANIRENAQVKKIYDLFANEQGEVELLIEDPAKGFIKDFPAKLQAYKQKLKNDKNKEIQQLKGKVDELKKELEEIKETKNVLLIGKKGVGKSSIVNSLKDEFKLVSDRLQQKNNSYEVSTFEDKKENRYRIIELVGFDDPEISPQEVMLNLAEVGLELKDGISQIFLAIDSKLTQEEVGQFGIITNLLGDEQILNHVTLIRTKFADFENQEECQKDYSSLVEGKETGAKLVASIGPEKTIYVDNSSSDSTNLFSSLTPRRGLTNTLQGLNTVYRPNVLQNLNRDLRPITSSVPSLSNLQGNNRNNATSTINGIVNSNIQSIAQAANAGRQIGQDAFPVIGAPVGAITGTTIGTGNALISGGVNTVESLVNSATGQAGLNQQINSLRSDVQRLNTENQNQTTRINSLDRDLTNTRRDLNNANRDLTNARNRVRELEGQISTLTTERNTAQTNLNNRTTERDTARGQVTTLTTERDTAIRERNTTRNERDARANITPEALNTERTTAQGQINTLTNERNQARDQRDARANITPEDLNTLRDQKTTAETNLAAAQTQITNLRQALSSGPQTGGTAVIQQPNQPPK